MHLQEANGAVIQRLPYPIDFYSVTFSQTDVLVEIVFVVIKNMPHLLFIKLNL